MKNRMTLLLSLVLMLCVSYRSRAENNSLQPGGKSELASSRTRLEPTALPAPPPAPLPDLVISSAEYEEGGKAITPGFNHKATVKFCVKNIGEGKAGQFQVRLTIYKNSDESSGLFVPARYFNFPGVLNPGQEKCSAASYDTNKTLFIGRGRLLWVDPSSSQGMVKESNEKNNKSWTNWPPKGGS